MILIKGVRRRRERRTEQPVPASLGREKARAARRESKLVLASVERRWPDILALSGVVHRGDAR